LAKRQKVFKVETIGDCYVACTGIPEPMTNHAVTLARFARNILGEMKEITHELADKLGEDTRDLELRIGLNSGSTTAGVLRGDKGRFQLFGDTVNTASRMESNGQRGRIHISESTKECLVQQGKGHWATPREDKIVAKGKGEMQSHWLNISGMEVSDGNKTVVSSDGTSKSDNANSPVESSISRVCEV
jgi:class 3 adenylate cyclase